MEILTYLVANYNQARYVDDCLSSLAEQSDDGWRCLLCDDGSSDDSLEVVRTSVKHLGIGDQVDIICNESNLGYIGTLRRMISEAQTDIVAILDADDALEPEATSVLLEVYAADPQVECAVSLMSWCNVNMQVYAQVEQRPQPGRTILASGYCSHIKSFRRRAYQRTAGYEDDCLYAEDRDLLYKLEEVTHPVFIDRVLYRYRRFVPSAQSHDPAKAAAMHRGIHKGRRNAVSRRSLRGLRRWLALLLFFAAAKEQTIRGAYRLSRLLSWLEKQYGIVAKGERLRRVPPPRKLPAYCLLDAVEAVRQNAV